MKLIYKNLFNWNSLNNILLVSSAIYDNDEQYLSFIYHLYKRKKHLFTIDVSDYSSDNLEKLIENQKRTDYLTVIYGTELLYILNENPFNNIYLSDYPIIFIEPESFLSNIFYKIKNIRKIINRKYILNNILKFENFGEVEGTINLILEMWDYLK